MKHFAFAPLTLVTLLATLLFCAACTNKYPEDPTRKGLPVIEPGASASPAANAGAAAAGEGAEKK